MDIHHDQVAVSHRALDADAALANLVFKKLDKPHQRGLAVGHVRVVLGVGGPQVLARSLAVQLDECRVAAGQRGLFVRFRERDSRMDLRGAAPHRDDGQTA